MEIHLQTLVSDIVAENYKAANIFKRHEIDFCCNGQRSIQEVSELKEIDPEYLIQEINQYIQEEVESDTNYLSWDIGFLSDYIYNKHHKYVEEKSPIILEFLNKICKVHGRQHPELFDIQALFSEAVKDLAAHMKKEELILFPYFKKLAQISKDDSKPINSPLFENVSSPIAVMHLEHDNEGERFRKISKLTNKYTTGEDACTTYRVCFAMLKEFEEDLHKHIHLENNILFKKALEIEEEYKRSKALS